jgi:hypothetical protein
MCRNDVSQALGSIEIGFRQGSGWRCAEHQGAVHSPCNPQRNDEPASPMSLGKSMRRLAVKYGSQRSVSHRYQRKLGKRAPLTRLQQDDLIAFGQPEGDSELVEGQELGAFLSNQTRNERRV